MERPTNPEMFFTGGITVGALRLFLNTCDANKDAVVTLSVPGYPQATVDRVADDTHYGEQSGNIGVLELEISKETDIYQALARRVAARKRARKSRRKT